jgi:hypothetical protein
MSSEQRRPKIGPTAPTGSFTSKEKIVDKIQEDKIRELENAQADAKKAEAEAAEQRRIEAIDKLLPKEVNASFGEVPFEFFKERFQTVWTQIAEKTHLTRGFCTYTFDVAPGLSVTIRTLKSGEMKFLRRFTPTTDPAENPAQYMDEDSLFRNVRFVIAVTEFDGNPMPDIEIPKKRLLKDEDLEEWLGTKAVADRFDWVDDLPEELTDAVAGTFVDLSIAYRNALQENLKNQFAPPSHS